MSLRTVSGKEIPQINEHGIAGKSNICPLSNTKGKRMLQKTLANHIKSEHWPLITRRGYYFCQEKKCPIIYYNNKKNQYFSKVEVRTTVMHKQEVGTKNRPLCYCKNVLEETVIDELVVKGCCNSLVDIQNYTGANTGVDCAITNPSGRCCGREVKEVLEWIKQKYSNIDPPLMKKAMTCCDKIRERSEKIDY